MKLLRKRQLKRERKALARKLDAVLDVFGATPTAERNVRPLTPGVQHLVDRFHDLNAQIAEIDKKLEAL